MSNRCNHPTSRGPCPRPVQDGRAKCSIHRKSATVAKAYQLSDPELTKSLDRHSGANLLDLSQQIVLLRGMIERRLNMAGETQSEQISAYNFVASNLASLTKMTETLLKLGKETGELMSRGELESHLTGLLEIISDELADLPDYEDRIDRILSKLNPDETPDE